MKAIDLQKQKRTFYTIKISKILRIITFNTIFYKTAQTTNKTPPIQKQSRIHTLSQNRQTANNSQPSAVPQRTIIVPALATTTTRHNWATDSPTFQSFRPTSAKINSVPRPCGYCRPGPKVVRNIIA